MLTIILSNRFLLGLVDFSSFLSTRSILAQAKYSACFRKCLNILHKLSFLRLLANSLCHFEFKWLVVPQRRCFQANNEWSRLDRGEPTIKGSKKWTASSKPTTRQSLRDRSCNESNPKRQASAAWPHCPVQLRWRSRGIAKPASKRVPRSTETAKAGWWLWWQSKSTSGRTLLIVRLSAESNENAKAFVHWDTWEIISVSQRT